ncbi:MAG: glycine cleavage system aminomethyltransferase GcvT [Gemmatimonadetes bacterium]|nr:glycine cleavage system aminomethyltransferase GcvT [Gemmatimonadota bacterium]NIR77623.1 glycine cleavage system aminomethyltransferase GcvT [Gemmatimonadota bacterium]NIT88905.1 glycine cleavage system aminomethyltransferase GcvT [Gemmatimonadota bacterium]NIU33182.1 glycine cleavage system aminomethyltransferase GcvT [Gemmatimonadota bacterium]NIU34957.1 glycine cleavage system aminomethyltransferase GcvT [Gemmatimonadota bacterium]
MPETLRKTALHDEHVALDAKMVPFAGFEMPVQYPTGITAEHKAVREAAGLFDVSHMGEVEIRGPEALDLVQHLTVNDASRLEVGQAQYSAICREDGGVLDDLLVYRLADRFVVVVNAANREKDGAWLEEQAGSFDAEVVDRSDEIALLALQGPRAQQILDPLAEVDLDAIGYYRFAEGRVAGAELLVSRTGYTGEDGFELYVHRDRAAALWRTILDAGEDRGLLPAGLGARDSLRLEVGYALYGNDLDEEHTPLEAGLGWITKLDKGDFVGREALREQKERGVEQRLVGLRLVEKGFPRPGYPITDGEETVGEVTSGTLSPTLGYGIALGYVATDRADPETELAVRIRGREIPAVVRRPPFYTEGSLRR